MDRIWSPWRFAYVTGEKTTECPFCEAMAKEDGPDNQIVRREAHALLILNIYPYNNGHCMVLPNRHVERPTELVAEESAGLWDLVGRTADLLRGPLGAQGVNVGVNLGQVSGASLEHLHVHLVPRWAGDTNFMPVIGQTKVLVEMLEDTYRRFRDAVRDWDA